MTNHDNSVVVVMLMVAVVVGFHDHNSVSQGGRYRRYRYCKKYCKCDESFHCFNSSRS